MIQINGLTKLYGDFVALRELTVTVPTGGVLGLVGPNGAGKTTTLRCLAGIIPPTRGTVLIGGHDIHLDPIPAKQQMAFFTDEPRLFDYLTVWQHLNFVARIYQVRDWEAIGRELLSELELADKVDKLPGELSRGMKQKLVIACGLLHSPSVIFFDEPLTGLDPIGIRRMKDSILKRARAGAAIIISSHLLHLVEEICSHLLILKGGQMIGHGTIDEIRQRFSGGGGEANLESAFFRATDTGTAATSARGQKPAMTAALLYLIGTTWRNRLVTRFKRLKQPKYLVGAIVGGLYFYFYFFRFLFRPRASRNPGEPVWSDVDPLLFELIGAAVLAVMLLAAWIFPSKRAALAFTEAEVAFLFPAPISRRALIHFKLLRSQLAILVTVLFLTLLSARSGSWGRAVIYAGGWWIALSTVNLHFLGASLERTRLLDRGLSNWQRRGLVLGFLLGVGVWVMLWARSTLPPLTVKDLSDVASLTAYGKSLLTAGPLLYVLAPLRLMVKPYLAPDLMSFLLALLPALFVLLVHYIWVVRSNVAFEEASLEASQKLAERMAAVRAGNWQSTGRPTRPARVPFRLSATGSPVMALLWKNLIGAGSIVTVRFVLIVLAVAFGIAVGFRAGGNSSGLPMVIASVSAMLAVWSLVFGPQVLRQDFRRELPQMDVLKALPLPGWQIALGQLLTPALLLVTIQWLLITVTVVFGLQTATPELPPTVIFSAAFSAAVLLPGLDLVSLLIPNGAVLLFPAWFQTGKDAPQGIEATGQRLIFALGQLLALILAIVPASLAFAACFFVLRLFLPVWSVVPVAAVAGAVGLLVTAGLGVWLLGWLFTRFDLSNEPTT